MKDYSRKIISMLLIMSMGLSLASCKKNKEADASASSSYGSPNVGNNEDNPNNNIDYKAEVVSEDDPFYEHEEGVLKIPIDTSKEIDYFEMDPKPFFVGDYIALGYDVSYVIPDDVREQLNQFKYPEEKDQYYEIYYQYWVEAVAIFSSSGEYLYSVRAEEECLSGAVFALADGTLGMVEMILDFDVEGYCMATVLFDENGEISECKRWTPMDWEYGVFFDRHNSTAYTMSDRRIVLVTTSGAALLDASGQDIWTYSGNAPSSPGSMMNMQNGFVIDGKLYVLLEKYTSIDEDHYEINRYLQQIDIATGEVTGDLIALSDKLPDVLFQGDNACYGIGANGIVKVDLFTGDREAVINWNETDVNYLRIEQKTCRMSSPEDMYFYQTVEDEKHPENTYLQMLHFWKADKNPHAGKTILHLSANGIYSETLMDCIVEYNRKPDGKARVLTYDLRDDINSTIPSFQLAEADLAYRVFLDMKSGVGPDIVMNFDSFGEFENESVLVDLNSFMDDRSGIDRSLYFDNVFRAFETNGKLFQLPLSFTPDCLLCDSAFSAGSYGWTYAEFLGKLDALGSDKTAFYSRDAMTCLDEMLAGDISYFVNYNSCEAKFDSQEFIALLEVAKRCEVKRDPMDSEDYDPTIEGINQGFCVMAPTWMSSLRWSLGSFSKVNGGNVRYVGYPSASGGGLSARAELSIGISSFSTHQEEAWDFIKSLLSTDIMVDLARGAGNPVNREALDILNQEDIDYYNEMKNEHGDDPYLMTMCPIDAESAKEYVEYLEHVTMKTATYPTILAVVEEEAAAYFAGQKSAEDVAKIIQDRVMTILQEAQ